MALSKEIAEDAHVNNSSAFLSRLLGITRIRIYFKFFLRNCPHAASISEPSSLLTVATIPWLFK